MTDSSDMQYYYSLTDGTPVFEYMVEGKMFLFIDKSTSPAVTLPSEVGKENTQVRNNQKLTK